MQGATGSDLRAIIVSHGQPSEPEVAEREINELAIAVEKALPERWRVAGATLATEGALESAVDSAIADTNNQRPIVYPLFMSDGWFTRSVLPQRLGSRDVRQLDPFGLDPGLVDLAVSSVTTAVLAADLTDDLTGLPVDLLVVGHGSGKSTRPAEITAAFAKTLEEHLVAAADGFQLTGVSCGYVEQEPFVADVARACGPAALCLPFFAAKRGHVLIDIPEALDQANFDGIRLDPIGCHPDVPQLIARALMAQASID